MFVAGNKKVFSTLPVTIHPLHGHYGDSYLAGLVLVDGVVIALIARAASVLEALNLLDQTGNAHSALACFILVRTIIIIPQYHLGYIMVPTFPDPQIRGFSVFFSHFLKCFGFFKTENLIHFSK